MTHLNISNEEQCWRFHWCFGIDDLLDAAGPVHGLVKVFGVEPVAVLPPIHRDAPVAFILKRKEEKKQKDRERLSGAARSGHAAYLP